MKKIIFHSPLRLSSLLLVSLSFLGSSSCADPATEPPPQAKKLVAAAMERTTHTVCYDGAYMKIAYPGGDVPDNTGVCTDVVIRSYRALNIDLQKEVHEDMAENFALYPNNWGLSKPDSNIDHRRVPNLQTFFSRKGVALPVTDKSGDYKPGDLVTWAVPPNLPHIGIVTDRYTVFGKRPYIVHNIGQGPKLDDMLFQYKITGHYRYYDPSDEQEHSVSKQP